jgi:radical SAM superfamily enzyme YgiQ (UPF0313 family)
VRILFVLPAAEHLRVTREKPEVPDRKMLRFSVLPLTTVAALTPPEHEVTICDENVEPLDLDADVDLVGVTFMTALAPRAYEIARAFRACGKVVVAGGFHPTLCADEAAAHFDAVITGDAEGTWPRLLADLAAGRLERVYRADPRADLAATPIPRRDLTADTARYYATIHAVQTGRGCVHACRYCSVTAFHRRTHRSRPLQNVLEELRALPRALMFVDDNIIADPEYARELFTAMVPLGKRWVGQSSIEIADDPELLRLARAAGCLGLFVGVETTSQENLAALDKAFNQGARLAPRIASIRRSGIGVIAGMIVGLDRDGPDVFQRTLRFLDSARIDALQLNIMTPLPGTPMYCDLEAQGRIVERDLSRYDFRHAVIQPARMSREELQQGADWLYAQFYRLDRILLRFVRSLVTLGPAGAFLGLRLSLTYRYDNHREGIVGKNPASFRGRSSEADQLVYRQTEACPRLKL